MRDAGITYSVARRREATAGGWSGSAGPDPGGTGRAGARPHHRGYRSWPTTWFDGVTPRAFRRSPQAPATSASTRSLRAATVASLSATASSPATPDRDLHPAGQANAYVRNGALGTVTALRSGRQPQDDTITVAFDGIGTIDLRRSYFDEHRPTFRRRQRDLGLDHAYAVTSYAVQGATRAVSTSRIDPTATRAEAYVDITRGQTANHLYLTRPRDPLDGEALSPVSPPPTDDAVTRRLARSNGELTAWELHQAAVAWGRQVPGLTPPCVVR
jgi:hypothetical protein